ncbi:MAG: SDR family NAD(P)-dependent oxidoreductase [Spirochaetaceae bacterium]|jgi:3-oxoacyl-[acyl-carrier protein] reductase|nr:SDR family NAD(P)-dependent oxidoreductase [Spirochaetaceae bacterium]
MVDVKGKWALITGASRGVGYELALFMAGRGCNLILHSRSEAHAEKILKKVKALNVEAVTVQAELSDEKQVKAMLQRVDALGMDVDFVFNNAGLQVTYRNDYYETPVEDYDLSFRVNTVAPMIICYHFLPKMVKRDFGRIINTTSGITDQPEQGPYSASKAALDKVTKDLGTKVEGSNVIISLTDPGWCRTDLGGPSAPNDVKDSIPGVALGAFLDDKKSGRLFGAPEFSGMSLEEALAKIQG